MSCYVQNYEVISIVTEGQNVLLTVGKDGSIIEKLKEILEKYMKKTEPEYYPPVENLLDLIYEHYTENNSVAPKTTVAGRAAKEKEKELEMWLRGLDGMDQLNKAVGYKGVQLITISRPTAYGEYAPYRFVDTEQEFQILVKGLRHDKRRSK